MSQTTQGKSFYLRRTVSAFVLIAFVATNHLASPAYAASPTHNTKSVNQITDLSTLKIPVELGKVQEVFKGRSKETVFLVQDAHAIPDAQRSIQKIIDYCQKVFGINLVAVEGAATELDPQLFRSFPNKDLLKKVFDGYLQKGELTGATAAAIFNDSPSQYFGVEDWPLYEEGLRFYLKAQENEQIISRALETRRQKLEGEKLAVYSKELLRLDQGLGNFHRNHTNLIEVLKMLTAIKAPEHGTELALLAEEISREKEHQPAIAIEVKNIAAKIQKALTSKSDLVNFNDQYQKYQTSQISPEVFALFLQGLAGRNNLSVQFSDRLQRLMKNQMQMRDIEGTKLFKDFERYAQGVKESLFTKPEQRKLDVESHNLEMIERLAKFELTRDDWNQMNHDVSDSNLHKLFASHISFYKNAQDREEVFFKNLTGLMKQRKTVTSLFIAGGFHTEGVLRKLKEHGISYVLLMPQIGAVPQNTNYRDLMRGSVSWKDYFRVENGKVNLYKAFIRASRDRLLVEGKMGSSELVKTWRDQIIRDLAKAEKITKVNQYTSFIDEVPTAQNQNRPEWLNKVDWFIDGLRKLDSQGKLTEQNIVKLFQPSTMLQAVGGNTNIAVGTTVDVSDRLILRSEVRAIAELRNALENWQIEFESSIRISVPGYAVQRPSNKAIRDNILDIITRNFDEIPVWMVLSDSQWEDFLVLKLFEELSEFLESADETESIKGKTIIEEVSDMLEILDGIGHMWNWYPQGFETYLEKVATASKGEVERDAQSLLGLIVDDVKNLADAALAQRQVHAGSLVMHLIQYVQTSHVTVGSVLEAKKHKKATVGGFERKLYYFGKFYDQAGLEAFQAIGSAVDNNPHSRSATVMFGMQSVQGVAVYAGERMGALAGVKNAEDSSANPHFGMADYLGTFSQKRIKKMLPKMVPQADQDRFYAKLGSDKGVLVAEMARMIEERFSKATVTVGGNVGTYSIKLDLSSIRADMTGQEKFEALLELLFKAHSGVTRDLVMKDIFDKAQIVTNVLARSEARGGVFSLLKDTRPRTRLLAMDWTGTLYNKSTQSLMPGAREFLEEAQRNKVQVVVITYNKTQDVLDILSALGIQVGEGQLIFEVRGIDKVQTGTENVKTELLRQLLGSYASEEIVTIGDGSKDILEANEAGVIGVAYLDGKETLSHDIEAQHPHAWASNLMHPELINYLFPVEIPRFFKMNRLIGGLHDSQNPVTDADLLIARNIVPEMSDYRFISQIKASHPQFPVAVTVANVDDKEFILGAVHAGADILVSDKPFSKETIIEIKQIDKHVTIISGVSTEEEIQQAVQNGADGIKIKPFAKTDEMLERSIGFVRLARKIQEGLLIGAAGGIKASNLKAIIEKTGLDFVASGIDSAENDAPLLDVARNSISRAEVRLVANEIVGAFKGEVTELDGWRAAQTIETTGANVFIPELLAATEEVVTRDDVKTGTDTKSYFEAIKAIDQPVVIEYQVSEQDLARMGANTNAIIGNLLQAAHDASATNKNIITRISIPSASRDLLRLRDHNQRDAVRLEKTDKSVTLYNNGLTGYQAHLNGAPTISVTALSVKGTVLFSDKYGDNQEIGYQGTEGSKVASQIFAAALVWVADSISQRTFDGLVQADNRPNGYRIANQNALYALSSLIELMAQYRSELRIKQAA